MKIEEKAGYFAVALADVYKEEENRDSYTVPKAEFALDITEDFTAMLLALRFVYEKVTGDNKSDLIDFTHVLNKLAVQYVMERMKDDGR